MKTQAEPVRIQTIRKRQQRNQLRRTANSLQQESKIVAESTSPMMISPEEMKVTDLVESVEVLNSDLLVSSIDENLLSLTDSSSRISPEITSDKAPAKSDESDIPSASSIVEFADDSTLSFEVIKRTVNDDGAESAEESEEKMKIDLLERYGIDSDRLKSLLIIDCTTIEDDINEVMCKKMRIQIFCFVVWIALALVILLSRSSSSGVYISRTPPAT